jgi:L-fuconolactonase
MGRRGFMMAAAASVAAGCASMHAPALLPILDTHTHFYDPQRPGGVRWPSKDDALLYRSVLPPEYETLARPLGIQATVIVEASPDPEDNDWVLALMPRHSVLRGVIGHLSPADPGFPAQWTRWSRRPGFLGIRTGGWDGPLDTSRPGFVEHCRRVAADRRVLEVLVGPEQLPEVVRLARAIPDLVVVVDHCANVRIDGKAPPGDWLKGMDALADCPRVHVKVSGLVEGSGRDHGDAPSDAAFYQPVLDALWARTWWQHLAPAGVCTSAGDKIAVQITALAGSDELYRFALFSGGLVTGHEPELLVWRSGEYLPIAEIVAGR